MPGRHPSTDRTYTHGERDSTRLNRQRLAHGRVDNPTPGVLRECINAYVCWWCGVGPWKSLGTHTASAHGILAKEVRELAGLFRTSKICSPQMTEECQSRDHYKNNLPKDGLGFGHKKNLSEAARTKATERLNTWLKSTGDPDEFRRRASRESAWKRRKVRVCTYCGTTVQKLNRYTCSPECRKAIRVQTAVFVNQQRYHSNDNS